MTIISLLGVIKNNWRFALIAAAIGIVSGGVGGWVLRGVFVDASKTKTAENSLEQMENANEIRNNVRRHADGAAVIQLRQNWSRK